MLFNFINIELNTSKISAIKPESLDNTQLEQM